MNLNRLLYVNASFSSETCDLTGTKINSTLLLNQTNQTYNSRYEGPIQCKLEKILNDMGKTYQNNLLYTKLI